MQSLTLTELFGAIYRKMIKRLSRYAEAEGLSWSESLVLWTIHKHRSLHVSKIANSIGLPPSTLTGMLDRLVAGGWIEREPDPNDRRAILVACTGKFEGVANATIRASFASLEQDFAGLPPQLVDRLVGDLATVLECLERGEESAR